MQQQSRQVGVLVCKSELQGYSSYSDLNSRNFNATPNLSEDNEFGLSKMIESTVDVAKHNASCSRLTLTQNIQSAEITGGDLFIAKRNY